MQSRKSTGTYHCALKQFFLKCDLLGVARGSARLLLSYCYKLEGKRSRIFVIFYKSV